jgi:N-acetylglucosamine-6-phosphate deacetylase
MIRMMRLALGATGLPDGDYDSLGQKIRVKGGLMVLEDSTITSSTVFLSRAVQNVSQIMKYGYHQVVQMRSYNPARLLCMQDERGSLGESKRADLVAVDPLGEVVKTIVGGKIVYQRAKTLIT